MRCINYINFIEDYKYRDNILNFIIVYVFKCVLKDEILYFRYNK